MVRNSRLYASWGVCERLLEEVWNRRFSAPREAVEIAELAVAVAAQLDTDQHSAALTEDLRSRAATFLANARRVLSDYSGAEKAFQDAEKHLAAGSGSVLELGLLFEYRSSLDIALGRFDLADDRIDSAIGIYRLARHHHLLGRSLIKKGILHGLQGRQDEKVLLVREGLEMIDADYDPQMVVGAWLSLIEALHHMGENREALALLARARPLYLRIAQSTTLIHFQWLEGSIALALDRHDQAEGCLREVRRRFLEEGIAADAALASLELVGLLVRQGRYQEVCRLAAQMISIFESRRMQTDALAALHMLLRAAEGERVTTALLERVGRSIRHAAEPAAKG